MEALETLQKCYINHDEWARNHKRQGGKVIGYTCLSTPEELLCSTGLVPVRITGSPDEEISVANSYLEDIVSPRYRSMLDLYLKGKYDYLDGWFLARQEDAAIRLYYTFKAFSEIRPANLFWLDKLRKKGLRECAYMTDELKRVRDRLENAFFIRITDNALAAAIDLYNKNRELLRKVDNLRKQDPPLISGKEFFQVTNAGFWMSKEEHNCLLEEYLGQSVHRKPRKPTVRIALAGSIQDDLSVIDMIEKAGATVVTDTLLNGSAYFAQDVVLDSNSSPLQALAEHLIYRRPSPVAIPTDDFDQYVIEKVKEADVAGVIFWILRWEDGVGWHYPDQKAMLDKLGIPHLLLDMQEPRLTAPERLNTRIETFIETLR